MKIPTVFSIGLLIGALAIAVVPAGAQNSATKMSAPIVVHRASPVNPNPPKSHSGTWMKVEVLHADNNSMVVSEQGNERVIHTFTYSPEVKAKMQAIIDSGGYQYGDRIKIRYTPGATIALKIHGKPSRPAAALNAH